jgi:hypothetical protein
MDRGHGRPHSYSSPLLHHQADGAPQSAEAAAPSLHPPRTHSHGARASHFPAEPNNAYGGQTWMDFLRESGVDMNASQPLPLPQLQHPPQQRLPRFDTLLHTNRSLPPLPFEDVSRENRFAQFQRPHSSETSSRSADRKRRLTTSDSPMRRPEGRPSYHVSTGPSAAAGSAANPISLDSPPPSEQSHGQNSLDAPAEATRRGSEFVLPPWQPDASVTHCFVCGTQFSFFYRKHHCRYVDQLSLHPSKLQKITARRKCGRVVCAACSPHRITIPRQFIVQPFADSANLIDLTAEDDDTAMSAFGPFRNPALGGGEEVRVCNPCVPDPNYSPPPPYSSGPTSPFIPFSPPPQSPQYPGPNYQQGRPRGHRSSHSVSDSAQTVGHGQTPRPRDPFTDRRVSYQDSTRVADLWPPTQAPSGFVNAAGGYNHRARTHSRPFPSPTSSPPIQPSMHAHMHSPMHPQLDARSMTPSMIRRLAFSRGGVPPSAPVPAPQTPPAPRRQIAEEDECPICGNELPPKGPNGEEADRVQHVEECIAIHSGSPPPVPTEQTSQSLPSQRTRGMSSAGNGEGASGSNRLSLSARGMYPYVATEKDCLDDQGNEAECVICFEEFEAGAKMARLVCWCKFHEVSPSQPCSSRNSKQGCRSASGNGGKRKGAVHVPRTNCNTSGTAHWDTRQDITTCGVTAP